METLLIIYIVGLIITSMLFGYSGAFKEPYVKVNETMIRISLWPILFLLICIAIPGIIVNSVKYGKDNKED